MCHDRNKFSTLGFSRQVLNIKKRGGSAPEALLQLVLPGTTNHSYSGWLGMHKLDVKTVGDKNSDKVLGGLASAKK